MPDRVAEIEAEVAARQHEINLPPLERAKGHAVSRRAVDTICLRTGDPRRAERERPAGGDRVAHRGLLDVGRHYPNGAERGCHFRQRRYARAVDAIVVTDQNPHAMTVCKGAATSLHLNAEGCGFASTGTRRQ